MPEAQQGRVTNERRVVTTAAPGACRAIPLSRYLLVQQLAVHVHLILPTGRVQAEIK